MKLYLNIYHQIDIDNEILFRIKIKDYQYFLLEYLDYTQLRIIYQKIYYKIPLQIHKSFLRQYKYTL